MQEIQMVREQLSASFLDVYLRIQQLDKALVHSPGTVVWKGPEKKYPYWQIYTKGKQSQHSIGKNNVDAVRKRIEIMRAQKEKRKILRGFLNDMKKALRAVKVKWQEIVEKYEEAKGKKAAEEASRQAAKKTAKNKKYADSYKHMTDKGDLVASKSEQLIANMLYARGIHYEYEQPVQVGNDVFKPDFTVWRRDGSSEEKHFLMKRSVPLTLSISGLERNSYTPLIKLSVAKMKSEKTTEDKRFFSQIIEP